MRTTSRKRTAKKDIGGKKKKKKDTLGTGEYDCPRDEFHRTHEVACQIHQIDTPSHCPHDCPHLRKVLMNPTGGMVQ